MCDAYLSTLVRRLIQSIIFILIEKLQKWDIPPIVINWIINFFLTDRTQQVAINGRRSSRLSITRSIVQGSGLGPLLFLIYIPDLKPICKINILSKNADDLSQLCPQNSPSDLIGEFCHIVRWAETNRLIINRSKTKEIVFRRPSLRHYIPPPPLMQIEQVEEAKLLWILLTPHCLCNRMLSIQLVYWTSVYIF